MLEVLLNSSRSFGGYEAETSRADLAVWEQIAETHSVAQHHSKRHGDIEITIDWGPRVRYQRRYCALWNGELPETATALPAFEFEHVHVCPASVAFPSSKAGRANGMHELHSLLVDLYLVANLSTPGAFNLYRSLIRDTRLDPAKDVFAQTELELSEYVFEIAWHESQDLPWLKVGFIPFQQVYAWFKSLALSGKSVAGTDLERALFSILQLGRASYMDQTAAMWIASALEALFDTPSGSSFTFLCRRITALLQLNESDATDLRKRLRLFFDLRNAFIHGGGRIHHILADDKEVESDVGSLLEVTSFASAVLIASVQELVRRGWKGMTFSEQLGPI